MNKWSWAAPSPTFFTRELSCPRATQFRAISAHVADAHCKIHMQRFLQRLHLATSRLTNRTNFDVRYLAINATTKTCPKESDSKWPQLLPTEIWAPGNGNIRLPSASKLTSKILTLGADFDMKEAANRQRVWFSRDRRKKLHLEPS